jgi:hypothetical protein
MSAQRPRHGEALLEAMAKKRQTAQLLGILDLFLIDPLPKVYYFDHFW